MIIVGREGSESIIYKQIKIVVSATPIADSRKGCPYKLRGNKFVQISRADNIRPYMIMLIYNIAIAVCRRDLHL